MADNKEVRIYGDPVLRKKAEPVEEITDELHEIIPILVETMKSEDGVGLAANQIGITKRVIAVSDGNQVYVLFNPKIVSWSERTIFAEEGCLSFPGHYAEVERSAKVIVKAMQEDGEEVELVARGIFARAIQHEIDHLDGILFVDRMKEGTLKRIFKRDGQEEAEYLTVTLIDLKNYIKQAYHQNRDEVFFDLSDGG